MKIELESGLQDKNRISRYSVGRIEVNNVSIDRSCIITANDIIYTWRPASGDDVCREDFDPVIALQPEIILFGTGSRIIIPPMELCAYVQERRIGFEFMDNGAAIRSYNILISEDRDVALALILS